MKRLLYSRWSGFAVAGIGIAMMCYGMFRGEMQVVFTKAVNICLECVGIG